jgi:hypothetical protein
MERAGKKLKRNDCGKKEDTGGFLPSRNNARRFMYYLGDNICLWQGTVKIDYRIKSINHTEVCICHIKSSD